MGLFSGLLGLPLAPVRGVAWVAEQVRDAAEREFDEPSRVRAELRDLVERFEQGELTEEEFDVAEDALLDRLDRAQHRTGRQ
ncbi:MAG: gas vesicle protein GvpG [Actinocatenispora sp.]